MLMISYPVVMLWVLRVLDSWGSRIKRPTMRGASYMLRLAATTLVILVSSGHRQKGMPWSLLQTTILSYGMILSWCSKAVIVYLTLNQPKAVEQPGLHVISGAFSTYCSSSISNGLGKFDDKGILKRKQKLRCYDQHQHHRANPPCLRVPKRIAGGTAKRAFSPSILSTQRQLALEKQALTTLQS